MCTELKSDIRRLSGTTAEVSVMASISDIAKRAGVSVSTVSHVVNGTRYVSPEKEEKVRKAIEEMEKADQLPNFIVKKKRQGSNRHIHSHSIKIFFNKTFLAATAPLSSLPG